jgi:hypothetical protein
MALWAPEDFNRQEILVDIPGPQRRYSGSWTMHELRRACMVIRAAANADCTPYYDLRRRAEQQESWLRSPDLNLRLDLTLLADF